MSNFLFKIKNNFILRKKILCKIFKYIFNEHKRIFVPHIAYLQRPH